MRKVCTILESVNQPVRCIQREQPKATLVLSTNNSVMEIFGKTLIGVSVASTHVFLLTGNS